MQRATIKEDIEGIRYCVLVGNERFYQFLEFCNSLQEAREIAYDYSESNAHHGVHNEEFWAFDTKKWKAYLPKYFEQDDQQFNPDLPIYIEGDDGRSERFINYINRLVNNRKDESIMVRKLNLRMSQSVENSERKLRESDEQKRINMVSYLLKPLAKEYNLSISGPFDYGDEYGNSEYRLTSDDTDISVVRYSKGPRNNIYKNAVDVYVEYKDKSENDTFFVDDYNSIKEQIDDVRKFIEDILNS